MRLRTRLLAALTTVLVLLPTVALAASSSDPRRSQMWWFDRIGVETAWDTALGDGIVVAVIDTGIDPTHPDLVDRLGPTSDGSVGVDLVDRDDDPSDPNGHGTIVAGLVAATANNGEGIAGVAPLATLLPVRVLDPEGRGQSSTVDAGIRWAVDHGADVVNLSLEVEESPDGSGPSALLVAPNDAIEYAWERGVIVIAATGNSGAGAAGYRLDSHVVLVGATDKEDELASFSDADRADAVMAPGVKMVSTWCSPTTSGCDPEARYGQGSGTSFAAPIVAGVAALLRSAGLDHKQSVDVLRASARDLGAAGPDTTYGVGIVDAAAAMAMVPDVLAAGSSPTPAADTGSEGATDGDGSTDGDGTPADGQGTDAGTETPGTDAAPGDPDGEPTGEDGTTDGDPLAAPPDEATDGPGVLLAFALLLLASAATLTVREARLTGSRLAPRR